MRDPKQQTVPRRAAFALGLVLATLGIASAEERGKLVQVGQDFSTDPGWEGVTNRVECGDCPTITQDFGWSPTTHAATSPGEIGGVIWRSTTPAWYAMPFGQPLSFTNSFSASGSIAVMPGSHAEAYFGFFGSERPGWRMWSSLAVRLMPWNSGALQVDYKTGLGKSGMQEPPIFLKPDGKVHRWGLAYESEARPGLKWPEERMRTWLERNWRSESNLLARAQQDMPDLSLDRLRELLAQASEQGLVENWNRKGRELHWALTDSPQQWKGRITFSLDEERATFYLLPGHADEPARIDRFGIFNEQIYSGRSEFYLADVVVNGHAIDLRHDPHWEGRGNRVTFVERDFHERQNFGYSETHWAGAAPGEIGGKFWSTEPEDPYHGFYADDIGELTLEDPLEFAGSVCFVDGAPDAQMMLGYFNRREKLAPIEGETNGHPLNQSLGIQVADTTRIGYWFNGFASARRELAQRVKGPIFIPDRARRKFHFQYDPKAGIAGRVTVALDGQSFGFDLTPEQRRVGATFDRFGLVNVRRGGKYNVIYFDDLTYTARRVAGQPPARFKQEIVTMPYPRGGRKY